MLDNIVIVRLSRKQAGFLQANLSLLAVTTRDAMTKPGLPPERRVALGSRATLLEGIEDVVRGALVEMPDTSRKVARGVEEVVRPTTTGPSIDVTRQSAA